MGELQLLKWIWKRIGTRGGDILVDSGDDSALVKSSGETLLKVDSIIEGVHFFPGTAPQKIGHKALARPLSDIAAMGGVPTFALVAMMMPRSMKPAAAKGIYLGMERLAKETGVRIVGGDLSTHGGKLSISVFVTGSMKGAKPVRRDGAKIGDAILVTGKIGGSIRGKHLTFTPRLREGRLFATKFRVHAMIDISDGLGRDLGHLCEKSGVGAEICVDAVPLTRGSKFDRAFKDGEDYELLIAADGKTANRIESAGLAARIGVITKGRGLSLSEKGKTRRVSPAGYEHRFKD